MIIGAGLVLTATGRVAPGHVVIEGDRIRRVGEGIPSGVAHVFPEGTLVPGFIDLQVNGGVGVNVLECTSTDVARLSEFLASIGVTGFLPTIVSAPPQRMADAARVVRDAPAPGAQVLGLHLEGPVLNPARKGAHDAGYLRPASDPRVRALYADTLPDLRLVTLAPEIPGAFELITWLVEHGVVVSLGHTDASYRDAVTAFHLGARMVTHLYNGMRGLHHREPGVVGAALDDANCVCGLIADGIHVHPAAARLAHRAIGADRIALVSDAVAALGMSAGEYRLGERQVRVTEGDAPRLPDGGLAGSVLRLDDAVRNMSSWGIELHDAVRSATAVPARVLGLADRGTIAPGSRADLCVLDPGGRAALTVIAGRVAWARSDTPAIDRGP